MLQGVVLAGGRGSRLFLPTLVTSKQRHLVSDLLGEVAGARDAIVLEASIRCHELTLEANLVEGGISDPVATPLEGQ